MTATASSKLMRFWTPERAIWALTKATEAAVALRFWQGTSTRPPTGSHTRPSNDIITFAPAARQRSGAPPASATAAAAAMAAALPTSAWQPPSAPDTLALRAMR